MLDLVVLSRRCGLVLLAGAFLTLSTACGGSRTSTTTTHLGILPQPTPDPTLDAVIRGLPGTRPAIATPTPRPKPRP
jgi:hypothetical protein